MSSGSYGSVFFGYSVNHGINESKRVLEKVSGNFNQKEPEWRALTKMDKAKFLSECHEGAHHQLFSGTPLGLFNWRLKQVIYRDIEWFEERIKKYGVAAKQYTVPYHFFMDYPLVETLCNKGCDQQSALYIENVLVNIKNCLRVQEIFFGANIPSTEKYRKLNMGQLCEYLNMAFLWMGIRSGLKWNRTWKVKGDTKNLVFNPKHPINAVDIAEAHAIGHELSYIRDFNDIEYFKKRFDSISGTSYELGVKVGIEDLEIIEGFGFSPSILRHRALLAFCTSIDHTTNTMNTSPIYIEDELPWRVYEKLKIFTGKFQISAAKNLYSMTTNQIYTEKANWDISPNISINKDFESMVKAVFWMGLNFQVNAFHSNSMTIFESLVAYLKGEKHPYDNVGQGAAENYFLIEYTDAIYSPFIDLRGIFKEHVWNHLKKIDFDLLNTRTWQVMAHILYGANTRNSISQFIGNQVPNPIIIKEKLEKMFEFEFLEMNQVPNEKSRQALEVIKNTLVMLIERGKFGESGRLGFLVTDSGRFIY